MESNIEDFDSLNLEVEKDSTFVSQNDHYFYLQNKSQIFEINEFGLINTYSLPEICNYIHRNKKDIYFGSKNRLYKLLENGTFGEKKFRQRILGFLPLDSEYPLLALISKEHKLFKLEINDKVIYLEKYTGRIDASVIYLGFGSENVVVCVYKTEGVVKYGLVGVDGNDLILLRKQVLTNDVDIRFEPSILYNHFLMVSRDTITVYSLDTNNYSLETSKEYHIDFTPYELMTLINDHVYFVVKLEGDKVVLEFRDLYSGHSEGSHCLEYSKYSESMFTCWSLKLGFNPKRIISIDYWKGLFKILVESEDNGYCVLSFSRDLPTESISYYDPYESFQSPKELERLIESTQIIITSRLVDHIIKNKLISCSQKILKCPHLPEIEAVKLLKNDISLLDEFLMYSKGSEKEFKKAFKSEIDTETFRVILDKLLESLLTKNIEDREYLKRVITMINILLDAKVMEITEFDQNMVQKMQELVEGCQKEHLDLQSLLSFTNTLLDSKIKYNTNPMITSIDISLE